MRRFKRKTGGGFLWACSTEDCKHFMDDDKGKPVAQSNATGNGTGDVWYLLDTRRALKPLIYQTRKAPNFVALTSETDDNVFNRSQYVYGVDARRNAGYGFWQLAHASNATLNAENLTAAITAMETRTGDHGRPLGISPNLLVVPKKLRFDAKKLLEADLVPNAAGTATESNPVKNVVDLLVAEVMEPAAAIAEARRRRPDIPDGALGLVEKHFRLQHLSPREAGRLAQRIGKTPVKVRNSPGFVVNRLLCPMINEAVFAVAEGLATPAEIAEAMKLGAHHPLGPLALCDLIGLDVALAIMQVLHEGFKDPKYRPAPLLVEMVEAGRLGRKTGQGFFSYV